MPTFNEVNTQENRLREVEEMLVTFPNMQEENIS